MTPFFQASRRSLAHHFTVNAPLLCPLFSICRKFLHFQPCFGQNFSSLDPNFSKFSFPRPPFLKENPLPTPYILKPAWHTPTKKKKKKKKKKIECPPGEKRGEKLPGNLIFITETFLTWELFRVLSQYILYSNDKNSLSKGYYDKTAIQMRPITSKQGTCRLNVF